MRRICLLLVLLSLSRLASGQPYDFVFPTDEAEFAHFSGVQDFGILGEQVYLGYQISTTDSTLFRLVRINPMTKEVKTLNFKSGVNVPALRPSPDGKWWLVYNTYPLYGGGEYFELIHFETGEKFRHFYTGSILQTTPQFEGGQLYFVNDTAADSYTRHRSDFFSVHKLNLLTKEVQSLWSAAYPESTERTYAYVAGAYDFIRDQVYLSNKDGGCYRIRPNAIDSTGGLNNGPFSAPLFVQNSASIYGEGLNLYSFSFPKMRYELWSIESEMLKRTTPIVKRHFLVHDRTYSFTAAWQVRQGDTDEVMVFRIDSLGTLQEEILFKDLKFDGGFPLRLEMTLTYSALSTLVSSPTTGVPMVSYVFLDTAGNRLNPERENKAILELFPNPTTDLLSIRTNEVGFYFSLCDTYGKEVFSRRAYHPEEWPLSLAALNSGLYYLRIFNADMSFRESIPIALRK